MEPVDAPKLLSDFDLPASPDGSLRGVVRFPGLVTATLAKAMELLAQQPLRKFDLPLAPGSDGAKGEILVLGYDKPASVVALKVSGEAGQVVRFLPHQHPLGEETFQIRGATIDGDLRYEAGSAWSAAAGSIHQPSGVLDGDGVYLVVTYWPTNTLPVNKG